jgi:hypothetical protein
MNNLTKSAKYLLVCLVFVYACGIEEPSLTPEEKYTVDTLFNQQLVSWRLHVDSSCTASKDTIFVKLVDSIKNERMQEIESLLMLNQDIE